MSSDMQLELAISRDIDDYLNTMLADMQKKLDAGAIWEGGRLENSQLSNLVAVAEETGSVEVVKNYIRYQIGRDEKGAAWRRLTGPRLTFGDGLIADLDALRERAQGIVAANGKRLSETEQTPYVDRTWIRLTRLYVGYMRRYLYYRNDAQKRAAGGR